MDYLTTHTSLSPIRRGFTPGFVNYKKGTLEPSECHRDLNTTLINEGASCCRDRIVVGYTTTYAISAYRQYGMGSRLAL